MTIREQLKNKTSQESATIKGEEIAKIDTIQKSDVTFSQSSLKIEVMRMKKRERGVEVFARAWDSNGNPIGFGKDGTVEIERFIIINPPILIDVKEGDHDVVREWLDEETGKRQKRFLKEDARQAILESLTHTIKSVGKRGTNIEKGKVGNTTSTFYPAAGANSPVDGDISNVNQTTYANARDAATGTSAAVTGTTVSVLCREQSPSDFDFRRIMTLFDTSSIGSDTITSETFSMYYDGGTQTSDDGGDIDLVTTTPAANDDLTTADYDQFSDTPQGTSIALASFTTGYNDYSTSGLVNGSGITKVGWRSSLDVDNNAGALTGTNLLVLVAADTTGTTKDPKLVVEHTADVAAPAIFFGANF